MTGKQRIKIQNQACSVENTMDLTRMFSINACSHYVQCSLSYQDRKNR